MGDTTQRFWAPGQAFESASLFWDLREQQPSYPTSWGSV